MNVMQSTSAATRRSILGSVVTAMMVVTSLLVLPSTARAQASAIGSPITLGAATVRLSDVAYDPVNDLYMAVAAANNGSIRAVRYDSANNATASFIVFTGGDCCNWGQAPMIEYVPHAPNGANGLGAFVVTWMNVGRVMGAVVSTHAVESGPFTVSDGQKVFEEIGAFMAYSTTSQRLLIVWQTADFGIKGRIYNASGSPVTGVFQLANANSARNPSVTWNPVTNQFGLAHTGFGGSGAFVAFRTVSMDGTPGVRDTFGFTTGTFNSDIDVHPTTGRYMMAWTEAAGRGSRVAEFDQNGVRTGTGVISTVLGDTTSMGLAFNPVSGTFLAVGQHFSSYEVVGAELNSRGVALQGATILTSGGAPTGSYYPRVAARTKSAAHWLVSYSRNFQHIATQLVGTSSTNGASSTTLDSSGSGSAGSTPTPAPTPTPTPPPTPTPSACPGNAPFPGAVCQGGGWVPGPTPAPAPAPTPTPTPTPSPSTCAGNAPVSGWVCVNGGWVPSSGGCSGSAPFAGAVCVNGGWVPGSGGSSSGCSGSAPFAGAVCVNGGWAPGTGSSSGCSGSAPFAGAVCQNGGWVPGGSGGSSTPAPTPTPTPSPSSCTGNPPVSGWVCVNGGWVPPNHPGAGGGEPTPSALEAEPAFRP